MIQSQTLWLKKNVAVASSFTSDWYNAEAINGVQAFLKYTGAVNTQLLIDLSPADARGVDGGIYGGVAPASCFEAIEILANGDNRTAGFCAPAAGGPLDAPFRSFRIRLVIAGPITACYLAVCGNALGGG